jgi:hypothetical protein
MNIYDVFVSYRHLQPDLDWVRTVLVPALDEQGFAVCVDYRAFEPGSNVIEAMSDAVQASRYTTAVLSPRFLESGFTMLERVLADHVGSRLIGLVLEPCPLPPLQLEFDVTALDELFHVLRAPEGSRS